MPVLRFNFSGSFSLVEKNRIQLISLFHAYLWSLSLLDVADGKKTILLTRNRQPAVPKQQHWKWFQLEGWRFESSRCRPNFPIVGLLLAKNPFIRQHVVYCAVIRTSKRMKDRRKSRLSLSFRVTLFTRELLEWTFIPPSPIHSLVARSILPCTCLPVDLFRKFTHFAVLCNSYRITISTGSPSK